MCVGFKNMLPVACNLLAAKGIKVDPSFYLPNVKPPANIVTGFNVY